MGLHCKESVRSSHHARNPRTINDQPRRTVSLALSLLFLLNLPSAASSSSSQSLSTSTTSSTTGCYSYSKTFGQDLVGVCVCNSTHCHELPTLPDDYDPTTQAVLWTTSKDGKRLDPTLLPIQQASKTTGNTFLRGGIRADVSAVIDLQATAQKIMGFGGSWTDSVALNVYSMNEVAQQGILEAYYGPKGLDYSLGRVTMASTDFSEGVFSYNDHRGDFNMTHFSIDVDMAPLSNKVPLIQRSLALSERNITIFASPWAPPVWMTTNNNTINSAIPGYPTGVPHSVEGQYWTAWALYFSKFLTAYAEQGIPVAAVTVQNEPADWSFYKFAKFQSLRMNSTTQRDFIKNDLGPRLRQDHPDVKIIIADDQKIALRSWTAPILDDPEAAQYVSGVAYHWYANMDFAVPGMGQALFKMIANHYERYPDYFLLASEACEGARVVPDWMGTGNGVKINQTDMTWARAENYARDIIGDLQSYTVGWTDWNLVLDLGGGPSWANAGVDAPILVDRLGGEEWYKQPMYYILGHFSKHVPAGSIRLIPLMKRTDGLVEMVTFLTADPQPQVVVVLQNRSHRQAKSFRIQISGTDKVVEGSLDRDSVSTLFIPL